MQSSVRLARKPRQGIALIVTTFALVALMALVSLSVDVGFILHARGQLQGAADSAALAAIQELRDTGSPSQAETAARQMAERHVAGGELVELGEEDFRVGSFDYVQKRFTPGSGFGAPAVQVEARRDDGAPGGPLPLLFARMLGRNSTAVRASAVAAIRRRDLVLVRDRSPSFRQESSAAEGAARDLILAMRDQEVEGDRVALINFARDTVEDAALTDLDSGTSFLLNAVNGIAVCGPVPAAGGSCWGTDIAGGIDAALTLLERESAGGDAERVIVIVSDAVPCLPEFGSQAVEQGEQRAAAAADRADDAGISIFGVTLDIGGGELGCDGSALSSRELWIRGYGELFDTANPGKLGGTLVSVLRKMPFYLVQ